MCTASGRGIDSYHTRHACFANAHCQLGTDRQHRLDTSCCQLGKNRSSGLTSVPSSGCRRPVSSPAGLTSAPSLPLTPVDRARCDFRGVRFCPRACPTPHRGLSQSIQCCHGGAFVLRSDFGPGHRSDLRPESFPHVSPGCPPAPHAVRGAAPAPRGRRHEDLPQYIQSSRDRMSPIESRCAQLVPAKLAALDAIASQ